MKQLTDDEIWNVLADAIEIINEKLKTKPNFEIALAYEANAMLNPKFR